MPDMPWKKIYRRNNVHYIDKIDILIKKVRDSQNQNIEAAANAIANAISAGRLIYAFGTGHSHMLAEEIFYRAGGLVSVYPILEDAIMLHRGAFRSSRIERISGYAEVLLENYKDILPGDVMLLFSNSGRNTVIVEMAQEAKKRKMLTICITSLRHSRSCGSRAPEGLKLHDICDIVIDNCGEPGDACMDISGVKCGPTSTVIGATILQETVCRAVEMMMSPQSSAKGRPEVFQSSNIDGGDEANAAYYNKYNGKIKIL